MAEFNNRKHVVRAPSVPGALLCDVRGTIHSMWRERCNAYVVRVLTPQLAP